MEKLTRDEIQAIENLITLEKDILNVYKKLAECEVKGLDNQKLINKLLELETKEIVLLCAFENVKKDTAIVEYLCQKINDYTFTDSFLFYLNNTDEKLQVKRLIAYFKRYADVSKEIYEETKTKVEERIQPRKLVLDYKSFTDAVKISQAIEKDNVFILLNNISDEIKNGVNKYSKEYLIKLKYEILYLSPINETRYIENGFEEKNHEYLEAKLTAEMIDIGLSNQYDMVASQKALKIFEKIIEKLETFSVLDFIDKEKSGLISLYFAMIKTLSVTLNNDQIEELKQKLNYRKTEENKNIIENVKYILSNNVEEKNKHKVVSMVRTRN